MKKFSETQPVQERETEREQLRAGIQFTLTGFVIQKRTRFPEGIAKINGLDMKTGQTFKFWYTGKAVIHQLSEMQKNVGMDAGDFNEPIGVRVVKIKAEKGDYLSFADPE